MTLGKVYLIPSMLGPSSPELNIPSGQLEIINQVDLFLVEKAKSARRFLRSIGFDKSFDELQFEELNKRTTMADKLAFVQEAVSGKNIGIISEAGCPGGADPGADIVKIAHEFQLEIIPLIGPSSLLLALMGSGLNGQSFAFVGYLPREPKDRIKSLQQLERTSRQLKQTQLFIETPYRNTAMFQDILKTCRPDTLLHISMNLTLPNAFQRTMTISEWKTTKVDLNKKPAVFAILSL
jgi:16S rRNA (cytidine1402-2'-O)-methyltransferase